MYCIVNVYWTYESMGFYLKKKKLRIESNKNCWVTWLSPMQIHIHDLFFILFFWLFSSPTRFGTSLLFLFFFFFFFLFPCTIVHEEDVNNEIILQDDENDSNIDLDLEMNLIRQYDEKKKKNWLIYHTLTFLCLINLILDVINIFHLIYLVSFVKYHCINDY